MYQQWNYPTTPLWMQQIQETSHYQKVSAFREIGSLGQMCDDYWTAILDNYDINILKDYHIMSKRHRNNTDILWYIPITITLRHWAHVIIAWYKTKTDLMQYLHGCCYIPIPRIFLKVINIGDLLTGPGLNKQQLLKHLPTSIATALGNMNRECTNLQPTNQVKSEWDIEEDK